MIDTELTWHQRVAALTMELGRAPVLDELLSVAAKHRIPPEELLSVAAKHRMPPEELRAQRDSFVRAEFGFGTDADEAAYGVALLSGDKDEIARHEAAAQARMVAFDSMKDRA